MGTKRRRKLDQYLRGAREDPEVVLLEMAHLSNRLYRLGMGIALTAALVLLVIWPLDARSSWPAALGVGVLLLLTNGLGWLAVSRIQPSSFERPSHFNQLIFLIALTVALSLFLMRWSPYLAPVPMLGMVLAASFGQPAAFPIVIGVGFYLGILGGRPIAQALGAAVDVELATVLSLGGVASVLGMSRVRQQSRPVMVGAFAGLVQGILVLGFQLIEGPIGDLTSLQNVGRFLEGPGWAILGGLISGAAVTCFLPALERFFGIVTERRLLALTDPSNDLLQALRNRAPGTHTHTLRVADLASAAAEAIGADPLLSRVGAYYHDIGKIAKPEYFVENRESGHNIHDRLRPSMSKLIIIAHVKEGVELAEEAKLPRRIIDMIPMHHGTTVVEYFYHKARTEGDPSEPEVEYRYPGPKPRFREAGILMMADGVEAAAKSIADPHPNRFRAMCHDLMLRRLLDHQLDECDLTMRDLTRIEDSFVRTLTYMYHGRIKYPERDVAQTAGQGDGRAPGRRSSAGGPAGGEPPAGPFERADEATHEARNLHRKPAEVTSARSGPAAKDPLGGAPRPWARGEPQRGAGG